MKTLKIRAIGKDWMDEMRNYSSYSPFNNRPIYITVLVSNNKHFADIFGDYNHRQMILQDLRDNVVESYFKDYSVPTQAFGAYKSDGDAIFHFDRFEIDEHGECLFAYYEFETTIS